MAPSALLDQLLARISEEAPAGIDITTTPDWLTIREARPRASDVLQDPPRVPDWQRIHDVTGAALAHKSKDLRLAVWLAEADIHLFAFAGLRDTLILIRRLLNEFWDTGLYPLIEDGDLQYRARPLEWLGSDNIQIAIRGINITARTDTGHNFSFFERTRVPADDFEKAVRKTPRAFVERTSSALDEALQELKDLSAALQHHFEENAPSLELTGECLQECRIDLDRLLKRKREEEPDPAPPAGSDQPEQGRIAVTAPAGSSGGGGSWEDAEDLITQGNVNEGLRAMTRLASQEHGRARFIRKLHLAEVCLSTERKRLAVLILEELVAEIDKMHLEAWESSELLARVWGRLHRCYKATDQADRGQQFFDRLCRLDPWQALSWGE